MFGSLQWVDYALKVSIEGLKTRMVLQYIIALHTDKKENKIFFIKKVIQTGG
jgi:hypothetical protein